MLVATCSVNYAGRLNAHLPLATRLIIAKKDGSVLIHSDGGSYKPLNWMAPPCDVSVITPDADQVADGVSEVWRVTHQKTADMLILSIHSIHTEVEHDLGDDPGLVKQGVEADLQRLVADQLEVIGEGLELVRREFPTAIGPVDVLARAPEGGTVAIEIKRRGDIDGVEQLTRYRELLQRDPHLRPVRAVFAAQEISPQARTLAKDRNIDCVVLDYQALQHSDIPENRLF
ncbi:NucS ssDNA endonuclease [Pontimonas salivibrio]|uniref:Endonuclease NucS n=1 Tax=Pontimonas salivibrio TaxID=1159327 RepID=A0A2L2BNG0_9MICO|nr:NucS ssDNA endonuclease [Pontimonas salivibrio]